MYHQNPLLSGRGISTCTFTMRAIQKGTTNKVGHQFEFDENDYDRHNNRENFLKALKEIKALSRSES